MFDESDANATATFYTAVEGESSSPYEDPESDWEAVHEDTPVFYDPRILHTEFVGSETGDIVQRADDLYAPIEIADDHVEGDRVDVQIRDRTHRWRIEALAERYDGDIEYSHLTVTDYGD